MSWLKDMWDEVFYKHGESFFKFDGWFGWDKIGHFSRHVIFVLVALLLGAKSSWAIIMYDTMFDLLYEWGNYAKGIGFSIMDVVYGRCGCILTLLIAHYILNWL